jgi:hypothetical protein
LHFYLTLLQNNHFFLTFLFLFLHCLCFNVLISNTGLLYLSTPRHLFFLLQLLHLTTSL